MTNRFYTNSLSPALGQLIQSAAVRAQLDAITAAMVLIQAELDAIQGLAGITDLSGFPASFSGGAGQYAVVNAGESAIEFVSGGRLTIKSIGGTTYTLLASDAGKLLIFTNASAITVTVPPDVMTQGDVVCIRQGAAGQVTLDAGSGVTFASTDNLLSTRTQSAQIAVIADGANAFGVIGERNAASLSVSVFHQLSCSDLASALVAGTSKGYFRAPAAFTITGIRASLLTASSSGVVTVDVNKNGTSVFSTTLTIDANEKTSTTAATAAVISTTAIASDDEITIDIDGAGTGAKGLIVSLIGTLA